jgi:hypothetical protein
LSEETPEVIQQLDDGIYFNLPEAIYHGQECMSSSNVQNMLVSPATFWADSWLNPDREPWDEGGPAQILGTAYHKARLEPAKFQAIYVPEPDKADFGKDLLVTGNDLSAELERLGHTKKKSGESVLEQARRLQSLGCDKPIWPIIWAEWEAELTEENISLPAKTYGEILRDMELLHHNVDIAPFLTGGQAEVTVIWTDEAGVRWKIRIDYLKPRHCVDLKTFENPQRKNLERCIADQIAYNRYYIQARIYWEGCEKIRTANLPIRKIQNPEQKALIEEIRNSPDVFEYWWIFQEKKGVPNVLARHFQMTREVHPHYLAQAPNEESRNLLRKKIKNKTAIWDKATLEVRAARDRYLQCLEAWPNVPWGALVPVSRIDDESFSSYFLES